MSASDIDIAHQLPQWKAGKPPTIIVKFIRRTIKVDFMREKAKLRNTNSVSFVDVPAHNIYLNEHLTASNRKKFAEARKQRDDGKFAFVWVKNGCIYIREEEGKPAVLYNEGKKWDVNRNENANGTIAVGTVPMVYTANLYMLWTLHLQQGQLDRLNIDLHIILLLKVPGSLRRFYVHGIEASTPHVNGTTSRSPPSVEEGGLLGPSQVQVRAESPKYTLSTNTGQNFRGHAETILLMVDNLLLLYVAEAMLIVVDNLLMLYVAETILLMVDNLLMLDVAEAMLQMVHNLLKLDIPAMLLMVDNWLLLDVAEAMLLVVHNLLMLDVAEAMLLVVHNLLMLDVAETILLMVDNLLLLDVAEAMLLMVEAMLLMVDSLLLLDVAEAMLLMVDNLLLLDVAEAMLLVVHNLLLLDVAEAIATSEAMVLMVHNWLLLDVPEAMLLMVDNLLMLDVSEAMLLVVDNLLMLDVSEAMLLVVHNLLIRRMAQPMMQGSSGNSSMGLPANNWANAPEFVPIFPEEASYRREKPLCIIPRNHYVHTYLPAIIIVMIQNMYIGSYVSCVEYLAFIHITKINKRHTPIACPECRVKSDFVCPSTYWVESKEEKDNLIVEYKAVLRYRIRPVQTRCGSYKYRLTLSARLFCLIRYMSVYETGLNARNNPKEFFRRALNKRKTQKLGQAASKGTCPFGNKCFYRHAYPDGTTVDVGPPKGNPRRRRRQRQRQPKLRIPQSRVKSKSACHVVIPALYMLENPGNMEGKEEAVVARTWVGSISSWRIVVLLVCVFVMCLNRSREVLEGYLLLYLTWYSDTLVDPTYVQRTFALNTAPLHDPHSNISYSRPQRQHSTHCHPFPSQQPVSPTPRNQFSSKLDSRKIEELESKTWRTNSTALVQMPVRLGIGKVEYRGSELTFVWRESGKPFRKSTPSSSERDSSLQFPIFSSLAQHDTTALANYATETAMSAAPLDKYTDIIAQCREPCCLLATINKTAYASRASTAILSVCVCVCATTHAGIDVNNDIGADTDIVSNGEGGGLSVETENRKVSSEANIPTARSSTRSTNCVVNKIDQRGTTWSTSPFNHLETIPTRYEKYLVNTGLLCLCANQPVSHMTLSFHIGSNTDAKSNVLIGQESAPKPPPSLKDHTCKPQKCFKSERLCKATTSHNDWYVLEERGRCTKTQWRGGLNHQQCITSCREKLLGTKTSSTSFSNVAEYCGTHGVVKTKIQDFGSISDSYYRLGISSFNYTCEVGHQNPGPDNDYKNAAKVSEKRINEPGGYFGTYGSTAPSLNTRLALVAVLTKLSRWYNKRLFKIAITIYTLLYPQRDGAREGEGCPSGGSDSFVWPHGTSIVSGQPRVDSRADSWLKAPLSQLCQLECGGQSSCFGVGYCVLAHHVSGAGKVIDNKVADTRGQSGKQPTARHEETTWTK
uniref:RING-type E3 ubiquitin transferase n=1 Tax=Timema californicum TaxID=61474 RepID=A0A7R9P4A7_TIMCA|nr:unnamed protein product [Timema californicum]